MKPLPLFSRSSTSWLENPSLTDSVSLKYQNSPGSGGTRHPCFVPFLSMPWIQSHPMTAGRAISWISTSVLIPRHCPHSSNLVIAIPVRDLRIDLPYFLWRSLTHHFQPCEARSESSSLSIPR